MERIMANPRKPKASEIRWTKKYIDKKAYQPKKVKDTLKKIGRS